MVVERLEWSKAPQVEPERIDDHEQRIWQKLAPSAYESSITHGFFVSLYGDTVWYIRRLVEDLEVNTVLEVGCGTGQVIESASSLLKQTQPSDMEWLGIDINPKFITHCKTHGLGSVQYHIADATKLLAWSQIMLAPKSRRSLVVCVNNTLSIMPEEIRPTVIHQMRQVAGREGFVFLSYYNGEKFRQGLVEYYAKNPQLCGDFKLEAQDFQRRKLRTSTGYTSHWPLEHEVESMLRCYGIPVSDILEVKVVGRGIFAVVRGTRADADGNIYAATAKL